jgi:hypothetical protein
VCVKVHKIFSREEGTAPSMLIRHTPSLEAQSVRFFFLCVCTWMYVLCVCTCDFFRVYIDICVVCMYVFFFLNWYLFYYGLNSVSRLYSCDIHACTHKRATNTGSTDHVFNIVQVRSNLSAHTRKQVHILF